AFGKKSIPRMNRIRIGKLRCADYTWNVQVAIDALRRSNAYGLIRESHMKGMAVRLGKHSNRLDTHFFAGKYDLEGDLTTIRYKYFFEHIYRGRMAKSLSPYSTGWPFSTRILTTSPAISDSISFMSFIASIMQTTVLFSTE